jgi:hypothetical protein
VRLLARPQRSSPPAVLTGGLRSEITCSLFSDLGSFSTMNFVAPFARPQRFIRRPQPFLVAGVAGAGLVGRYGAARQVDCKHFNCDCEVSGKTDAKQSKHSMPVETRSARNGACANRRLAERGASDPFRTHESCGTPAARFPAQARGRPPDDISHLSKTRAILPRKESNSGPAGFLGSRAVSAQEVIPASRK